MGPTIVLLVGVPRMLADIVRQLAATRGDVVIAGEVDRSHAVEALERTDAGVVITGAADDELVDELLTCRPRIGVLALTADGRDAVLHRLVALRTPLGELWLDHLLSIVRSGRASQPQPPATKGAETCL